MTGFLPGILKITLFADLLIGLVWLLSIFLGSGSGYRWRKLVWLILALRLLIPVSVSFADISERLPLLRVSLPAAEEKQGDLQSPEEEIEAAQLQVQEPFQRLYHQLPEMKMRRILWRRTPDRQKVSSAQKASGGRKISDRWKNSRRKKTP